MLLADGVSSDVAFGYKTYVRYPSLSINLSIYPILIIDISPFINIPKGKFTDQLPILLIGNKCDLPERTVSTEEAKVL